MSTSLTGTDAAAPGPDTPSGEPPAPYVGIFWGVPDDGRTVLVTDRTPLAEAEAYGDCLTHPRGHHEVWEAWRRLGATALRRRGLPPAIAGYEYEAFPRGRVVYMRGPALFTLYADRRLQRPEMIADLVQLFGLTGQDHVVHSDAHYRTHV
ncbi:MULTISPECIES: hypothetical protein [Methylobacterium]|uniref:hypothetical protein n=1 Tax=Methylobacterium TaxID=407 RepID=UPI0006924862|nr:MULTISPECIES: hypothetical protein [Methylobacterium]MDH3030134.1 hypothetical protein [Methylobacterium fujisawaense]SFV08861.1 hypothetical protein SAMN02799643_05003 [Methylobacterium sp. UNCCL125]